MKVVLAIICTCTVFAGSVQSASDTAGAPCQASAGIYRPNPLACDSYLVCANSKLIQQPCPAGLHWNRVALTCDWPTSAKCTLAPAAEVPQPTTTQRPPVPGVPITQPGDDCDVGDHANNVGLYRPHPSDCTQYLTCLHGKYIVRPCGALHWNAQAQTCDRPENAKCTTSIPPSATARPPQPPTTRPPAKCPPQSGPNELVVIYPEPNCGWFYVCENGRPAERPCPTGLAWNSSLTTCDWPTFAGCAVGSDTVQSDAVLWIREDFGAGGFLKKELFN